ncbi:MAG: peptidoglycan DD-metalloendopeptidase family protein [Pyrinomonadaceae bacterium]
MRKLSIFNNKAILISALVVLSSSACVNSSNSNTGVWYRNSPTPMPSPPVEPTPQLSPSPQVLASPVISPSPAPTTSPLDDDPFTKENETVTAATPAENAAVGSSSETLMIPVVGIKREDLRDTFNDARSEGRVHDAIDIMAAKGTPVVAATTGKIVKFFDSERGGITVYQLSPDEHTVYYYAHLERRANGLSEGALVQQGDLIGYVGDTGNAGPGNNHLHFAIWTITDPKRFYEGTNINPYLLLKDGKIAPQ